MTNQNRHRPACQQCGRKVENVLKAYRLNPRNLQPDHQRLCPPCRSKLGYTVDKTGRGMPHPATNPDVTRGRGTQR